MRRLDPLPLLVAGLVSVAGAWTWGGLDMPPVVHDEASYLLQAQIFASGHLVGVTPALPRFFDQFHVLVSPVVASKYPPMTALALTPGVLLGVPGLVPVLTFGASAALVFWIARRLLGLPAAVLSVLLYQAFDAGLNWRLGYNSNPLSELWWLTSVVFALRGGRGALAGVAVCLGLTLLTRPLTCIGLAPGTLWLLRRAPKGWSRREVGVAVGVLGLSALLMVAWDAMVTGDPLDTPWSLWARQYMPGDRMGFGWDAGHPLVPLDADRTRYAAYLRASREAYTLERLPGQLDLRLRFMWQGWFEPRSFPWGALVTAAVAGLATRSGERLRPLASSWLGLFLVHILFPHGPLLTRYYLDADLVPALAPAAGVMFLAHGIQRRTQGREAEQRAAVVIWLLAMLVASGIPGRLHADRAAVVRRSEVALAWRADLAALPGDRHVVFVRYAGEHDVHKSLIVNEGDLEAARVWTVLDRGEENAALMALAPDRRAWLYDEATRQFTPL